MSEQPKDPNELERFTREVSSIHQKTRMTTNKHSQAGHSLENAARLFGRKKSERDESKVYKKVIGVQEIMIEDNRAEKIMSKGHGIVTLEEEAKTKIKLKVGSVIKLAPDNLPEIPVKITAIDGTKLTVEIIFEDNE